MSLTSHTDPGLAAAGRERLERHIAPCQEAESQERIERRAWLRLLGLGSEHPSQATDHRPEADEGDKHLPASGPTVIGTREGEPCDEQHRAVEVRDGRDVALEDVLVQGFGCRDGDERRADQTSEPVRVSRARFALHVFIVDPHPSPLDLGTRQRSHRGAAEIRAEGPAQTGTPEGWKGLLTFCRYYLS